MLLSHINSYLEADGGLLIELDEVVNGPLVGDRVHLDKGAGPSLDRRKARNSSTKSCKCSVQYKNVIRNQTLLADTYRD
jgi:hypothetical protein